MFGLQRSGALAIAAVLLTTVQLSLAANSTTQYVEWTDLDGMVTYLADDRKPALYTQNFGDCLGSSVVNVTRFDAAYYKDNMTVVFHLEGDTAVVSESVMSMLSSKDAHHTFTNRIDQCTLVSLLTARVDST